MLGHLGGASSSWIHSTPSSPTPVCYLLKLLFFLSDVGKRILEELRDRGKKEDAKRGTEVAKIAFLWGVTVKPVRNNSWFSSLCLPPSFPPILSLNVCSSSSSGWRSLAGLFHCRSLCWGLLKWGFCSIYSLIFLPTFAELIVCVYVCEYVCRQLLLSLPIISLTGKSGGFEWRFLL